MTSPFFAWSPDDSPGSVVSIRSPADWQSLSDRYTGGEHDAPLSRIFAIAAEHGVTSILVEHRYIDADWRSQHAEFYGSTFRRFPSVCHRLHFFCTDVPDDLQNLDELQDSYRGYAVMRPLAHAPVGRTMICPPPDMAGATVARTTETVHLFGWALTVTAMPFISQDRQYLRCAHASLWMVLRHAEAVHGVGRRLPKDIHEACSGGVVTGRQVPSAGLTQSQILNGSTRLGLSMARMSVPAKNVTPAPGEMTLYSVLCRYIRSQLPPIVLSPTHAWVVVGWRRSASDGHPAMTLWRHDDAVGPYVRIDDPHAETGDYAWSAILMPLMTKMYIAAERAEIAGRAFIAAMLLAYGQPAVLARQAQDGGSLTFRTYAAKSIEFKQRLSQRALPHDLATLYRFAHMPRYIWVVEAVDRRAREAGRPDVLGEVLIDSTESEGLRPQSGNVVLAAHVGGVAFSTGPDHRTTQVLDGLDDALYYGDASVQDDVKVRDPSDT